MGEPAAGPDNPFRDGWFHSSDRGSVSVDGRVYLKGRAGDVLNLAGAKMDSARVEALVAQDPAVLECVAVVVDKVRAVPVLAAVVVATGEVDFEAEQLGRGWVPVAVVRVDELPRNEGGKLQRERILRLTRAALLKARRAG